jgi:YVTN family beta-propeller protein
MNRKLLLAAALVLASAGTSHAQPFAYSVNSGTRNVSVIDTVDNTIKATIPLPDTAQNIHPYAYGVTVGPSGQYIYVGLQDTNEVAVIDTARNTVVKRIGMGTNSPGGLAVNGSETRLYVTSHMSNLLLIYDITGSGAQLVGAVAVSDLQVSNPEGVVLSPAGDRAYVANSTADSIAVVSLDDVKGVYTRESLIPLSADSKPMALAMAPDGSKLYVSRLNKSLQVINILAAPPGITNLGGYYTGVLSLTPTPDGSKVYAPSNTNDYLMEITTDPFLPAITGYYPLAAGPLGSSITPDGTKLYVTMNTFTYGDSVKVFSTSSNTVTATIALPVGARPTGIGNFIGPLFSYTIYATQGFNCTILPQGSILVNSRGRVFDISGSNGPCEVKVDGVSVGTPSSYAITNVASNHTIDASMAPPGVYYTLNVSTTPGYRCLQSTPAGISCVSTSAQFLAGTSVTLSPPPGFTASNWGGNCAGAIGSTCTLVMNSDKSASVNVNNYEIPCLAKIGATCYATIDDAINGASSGDLIKVVAAYTGPGISTTGGPFGTVTISGGWDSSFMDQFWFSSVGLSTFRAACAIAVDGLSF